MQAGRGGGRVEVRVRVRDASELGLGLGLTPLSVTQACRTHPPCVSIMSTRKKGMKRTATRIQSP